MGQKLKDMIVCVIISLYFFNPVGYNLYCVSAAKLCVCIIDVRAIPHVMVQDCLLFMTVQHGVTVKVTVPSTLRTEGCQIL